MINIVPQPQGDERVPLTEITEFPVIVEHFGDILIVLSAHNDPGQYTVFNLTNGEYITGFCIPGSYPVFLHNEPVTIQNK